MTSICPLTQTYMCIRRMLKISDSEHYVNPGTFKQYIYSLQLGIDIDLATEEEWVITARSETFDNSNTIKLRNPLTNLHFSEDELRNIYNKLTNSNFR